MRIVLFLILLQLSTNVFADEWIADPDSGCKVFNSNPKPDESIKWTGACKDGKASGSGSVIWYKSHKFNQRDTGVFESGVNKTRKITEQGVSLFMSDKHKESMPYFQEAADLGDSNAMQWLANIYLNGLGGVQKNQTKGIALLNQALSTGDETATYNLGLITFEGNGVTRDYNKAAYILKKSLLSPLSKGMVLNNGKTIYSASEEILRKLIDEDLISDPKIKEEIRQVLSKNQNS